MKHFEQTLKPNLAIGTIFRQGNIRMQTVNSLRFRYRPEVGLSLIMLVDAAMLTDTTETGCNKKILVNARFGADGIKQTLCKGDVY